MPVRKPTPTLRRIALSKVQGKRIHKICDANDQWREYRCGDRAPRANQLFNFDLTCQAGRNKRQFLVLDPYGDETISSKETRKHLALERACSSPLVIDRKTGSIHMGVFYRNESEIWMVVARPSMDVPHTVPKKYMSRLDELKSEKRPFTISAYDTQLFSFIDRWIGYSELREALTIKLRFKEHVEIGDNCYRETSGWKVPTE